MDVDGYSSSSNSVTMEVAAISSPKSSISPRCYVKNRKRGSLSDFRNYFTLGMPRHMSFRSLANSSLTRIRCYIVKRISMVKMIIYMPMMLDE